jgi:uncharacterized protein
MVEKISLSAPLKRIKVLDALRGFALLGVILMHMIQHFGIRSLPSENSLFEFPVWDETIRWIGNNIIMGRFINFLSKWTGPQKKGSIFVLGLFGG